MNRKKIYLLVILMSIYWSTLGCSSKKKLYEWKHNVHSGFTAYSESFLKDDTITAKYQLALVIKESKMGESLEPLASIYLGVCALNKAVGVEDNCTQYREVSPLLSHPNLNVYYKFLHHQIKEEETIFLPPIYQNFAHAMLEKKFKKAFDAILKIEKTTSFFIASFLMKEKLTQHQRAIILERASQYGYKKVVLFWLSEIAKYSHTRTQKEKIEKKIVLLKAK